MAETTFNDQTLKRQFATYKWARNNTLQILKVAQKADMLDFTPDQKQHTVLYQFQCLATTDDTYYRKLTNNVNQQFGVRVEADKSLAKTDIPAAALKDFLQADLRQLESLLATYTSEDTAIHIQDIQRIFNHEYLHQGQLVVLFRQAGVELPERFKKAFDL